MSNIIIKQTYFTNAQTAINSLNEFFSSGFKTRNFPVLDNDFQLEPAIEKVISRLSSVDPTWIDDESKLTAIVASLNEACRSVDPVNGVYQSIVDSNNEALIGTIDSYIGFKYLQIISENFEEFNKFMNGLYTFQLFCNPTAFTETLDLFGQLINFDEVPDLDVEEKIFDEAAYVAGIMKSDQIQLPPEMTEESEVERLINRQDIQGVEVMVDDTVQEAAAVNYFEDAKPTHLKYSDQHEKWMVSQQFQKVVNDLTSALRKCDTTDDLIRFFGNGMDDVDPNMILETVCPYILAKAIANPSKYQGSDPNQDQLKKYTDSYDSIIKDNDGAARFKSYDIFSTFKTDKEGTIKFIEDFLKMNLVNRADVTIDNNTLLALFNIFDSRIYLDIAYNVAPESITKEKSEDAFVKEIRGRINKNSHTKNAYSKKDNGDETAPDIDSAEEAETVEDNNNDDTIETTETVSEYVLNEIHRMGDMNHSDMMYCENFFDLIEEEIETIGDRMFNARLSPLMVDEFIGESYNVRVTEDEYIVEANIEKRRTKLQQAVCSVIDLMEKIVAMDKKKMWNDKSAMDTFKTYTSGGHSVLGTSSGFVASDLASSQHVDVKNAYIYTSKALKGKYGKFDQKQLQALSSLKELLSSVWKNTKMFWANPKNYFRRTGIFRSHEVSDRTKNYARLASKIVALKPALQFIYDDKFVNEATEYETEYTTVFQEATTKVNNERFNNVMALLKRDMTKISEYVKNKQWNNNACITMFKGETYGIVKQSLKYVNRAMGGSCGNITDIQKSDLKTLREHLEDVLKCVRTAVRNPFIGKNIKEAGPVHKVGSLASIILDKIEGLDLIKPVQKSKDEIGAETTEEKTTTEAFEINDIDSFMMIMEQEDGSIPAYLQARFKVDDGIFDKKAPEQVGLPNGVPANPIDDLTDSIGYKIDSSGDNYDSILGSGYEEESANGNLPNGGGKGSDNRIVVNITNNYTNSFNRDSYNKTTNTNKSDDHSTGKTANTSNTNSNNKTNSENDSSHDNDTSSNKSTKTRSNVKNDHSNRSKTSTSGSNNNNNNNGAVDTYDSPSDKDGKQKLSSGKTIAEMFTFLESSEPQSLVTDVNPPKEDLLTKAMDRDRETLAKQQSDERGVEKAVGTIKAAVKPIERRKAWVRKQVESLIKRDEDRVKMELTENPSYRSAIFKAYHLALKLGMIGVCFAIQPHLGAFVTFIMGLNAHDKRTRAKKQVQREMTTQLEIINDQIKECNQNDSIANRKKKYELMRLRSSIEDCLISVPKRKRSEYTYFDEF